MLVLLGGKGKVDKNVWIVNSETPKSQMADQLEHVKGLNGRHVSAPPPKPLCGSATSARQRCTEAVHSSCRQLQIDRVAFYRIMLKSKPTQRRRRSHPERPSSAGSMWHHASLHTPAALRARAALRHNRRVEEVLDLWWSTAVRSMLASGKEAHAMCEDEYVKISTKIYRAMIVPYDEAEATQNAHHEWQLDTKGETELPCESFKDAIFELADLWTEGIDAVEYAALPSLLTSPLLLFPPLTPLFSSLLHASLAGTRSSSSSFSATSLKAHLPTPSSGCPLRRSSTAGTQASLSLSSACSPHLSLSRLTSSSSPLLLLSLAATPHPARSAQTSRRPPMRPPPRRPAPLPPPPHPPSKWTCSPSTRRLGSLSRAMRRSWCAALFSSSLRPLHLLSLSPHLLSSPHSSIILVSSPSLFASLLHHSLAGACRIASQPIARRAARRLPAGQRPRGRPRARLCGGCIPTGSDSAPQIDR